MNDTTTISVVLVDDDPEMREVVGLGLARSGRYTVLDEAQDGLDGVLKARQHQPDVILLDLHMPVLNGAQALPHLRRASSGSTIILFTSLDHDEIKRLGATLDIDGHIGKPTSMRHLPDRIAEIHAASRNG